MEVHALLRPAQGRQGTGLRADLSHDLDPVRRRLRAPRRAERRLRKFAEAGVDEARLYGADEEDGVGGFGAFFLLLDEPEVYGLPPDPVVTTRHLGQVWGAALAAAAALGAGLVGAVMGGRR